MTVLLRCAAALACAALAACSSSGQDGPPRRSTPFPTSSPSASLPGGSSPSVAAGSVTYLALGDSVAAGAGATDPATHGYVPVLAGLLSARLGCDGGQVEGCPVRVSNLAVAGATTGSLLADQLPRALPVIEQSDDLRLVTVTIGGNDVFGPVVQACARTVTDPACRQAVRTALRSVDAGVDEVLRRLTAAAGPATTVAVMTYDNPLPACRLASLRPLAEQVLEGTTGQPGLNDRLRARASEHGARVVETVGLLRPPEDFVGGLDCLHPSTTGHARIAQAFLDVVAAP